MKTNKRVLVAGGTGFVGRALCSALVAHGHSVAIATRDPAAHRTAQAAVEHVAWLPDLARFDAVVNLAGANLFGKRWSASYKAEIRASRVDGTRRIVDALAAASKRPAVLVSGSAVGIYGDQGDRPLSENATEGSDFLAEVCHAWEQEAQRAEALGVRVVRLRTGVALGPGGGALSKMLLPFKLGLGGPIGSGKAWMSWIHVADLAGLIVNAVESGALSGAVNAVSPGVCTNREFTQALGRALHRPALVPIPPLGLRVLFGEVGSVLTSSQRCVPERALTAGYSFQFAGVESALRDIV